VVGGAAGGARLGGHRAAPAPAAAPPASAPASAGPLRDEGSSHAYDSVEGAVSGLSYESALRDEGSSHAYDSVEGAVSGLSYDSPISEDSSLTYESQLPAASSPRADESLTYESQLPAVPAARADSGGPVIYSQGEAARAFEVDDDDYISDDDVDDDYISDDDDDLLPEVPLTGRAAWHADMARHKRYATTPLDAHYVGEETNMHEQGHLPMDIGGLAMKGTHYADSAAEYGVSAQEGLLTGARGPLDSTKARAMWAKDKDQRLNFALDGAGGLYAADPMLELARKLDRGTRTGVRNNHSSLVGGADVAAAGTMKVRGGKVEELADNSGHYRPGVAQTHQAAEHMVGAGVMDEARSTVSLSGKGDGQRELNLSTTELLAYGPEMQAAREAYARSGDKAALAAPEKQIRKAHAKKDAVHDELLRTRQRQE
jgi:hypothetical protein